MGAVKLYCCHRYICTDVTQDMIMAIREPCTRHRSHSDKAREKAKVRG